MATLEEMARRSPSVGQPTLSQMAAAKPAGEPTAPNTDVPKQITAGDLARNIAIDRWLRDTSPMAVPEGERTPDQNTPAPIDVRVQQRRDAALRASLSGPIEIAPRWVDPTDIEGMMQGMPLGADPQADQPKDPTLPIGFMEAIAEGDATKLVPILGTVVDMQRLMTVRNAAKRLEADTYANVTRYRQELRGPRPYTVTPDEQRTEDAQAVADWLSEAEQKRLRGYSFGGQVGRILGEMPAFMGDIALTGGAFKAGAKITEKAIIGAARKKLERGVLRQAVTKVAAPVAETVVGGTLQGTVLPHRIAKSAIERQMPQGIAVDDTGKPTVQWSKESPATSLVKAWGDTVIETISEQSGEGVNAVLKAGLTRLPFGGKLMRRMYARYAQLHPETTWGQFADKVADRVAFSGVVGEIGEEYIGDQLRAITNVDDFGAGADATIGQRMAAAMMQDLKATPAMATSFAIPGAVVEAAQMVGAPAQPAARPRTLGDMAKEVQREPAVSAESGSVPVAEPPQAPSRPQPIRQAATEKREVPSGEGQGQAIFDPEVGPFTVSWGTRSGGNKDETFDDLDEALALAKKKDRTADFVTIYDGNGNERTEQAAQSQQETPKTQGQAQPKVVEWFRGESQANATGDLFFSQSEDVADGFGRVRKMSDGERPKNTLVVDSKEALAGTIGYTGDPLAEPANLPADQRFDTLAKQYAQSKGYDSIQYTSGTLNEPEMHVFRQPATATSSSQSESSAGASGILRATAQRIQVDPARLSTGTYRGETKTGEGDISAAYSGDLISAGKIRKPFTHDGTMYVTTTMWAGGKEARAWRIVPESEYESQTISFNESLRKRSGPNATAVGSFGYEGVRVTWKGKPYVMTGGDVTFAPQESGGVGPEAARAPTSARVTTPPAAAEPRTQKPAPDVKTIYTGVPDEWRKQTKLVDWGKKGLRTQYNTSINGRKSFAWSDEFERVPTRTPAVIDAARAKTDEVFQVHKRGGEDYWLVPKRLMEELKRELPAEAFARKPKPERSPLQKLNDLVNSMRNARDRRHEHITDAMFGENIIAFARDNGLTEDRLSDKQKAYVKAYRDEQASQATSGSVQPGVGQEVPEGLSPEEAEERLAFQTEQEAAEIGDFLDGIVDSDTGIFGQEIVRPSTGSQQSLLPEPGVEWVGREPERPLLKGPEQSPAQRPELSDTGPIANAFNAGYDKSDAANPHIPSSPLGDAFALGQYARANKLTGKVRKSRGYTWFIGDTAYRVDAGTVTPAKPAGSTKSTEGGRQPARQAGIDAPAKRGATHEAAAKEAQSPAEQPKTAPQPPTKPAKPAKASLPVMVTPQGKEYTLYGYAIGVRMSKPDASGKGHISGNGWEYYAFEPPKGGIAFGYVMGDANEWGSFSLEELRENGVRFTTDPSDLRAIAPPPGWTVRHPVKAESKAAEKAPAEPKADETQEERARRELNATNKTTIGGREYSIQNLGPGKGWITQAPTDVEGLVYTKGGDPRAGGFSKAEAIDRLMESEVVHELRRLARQESETEPIGEPNIVLARRLKTLIAAARTLTEAEFWQMADEAYGGTRAEGKYGPSEAYDDLELALNMYLRSSTWAPSANLANAISDANWIEELLSKIPRQKSRSGEKDLYQQFSTPPHYAYAVAWLANVTKDDTVLEPSAGVGGIAVFAKNAGARVIVNEISDRRAKMLEAQDFDRVTREDAEQIHNILNERPTVVVMNPPFSHAAQRMGDKKIIGTDLRHIDAALALLQDGGRLVAIMGRPLQEDKGESVTFQRWMTQAQRKYNVRANAYVGRGVYKSFGTDFPTRVLVIDKTGPTSGQVVGGTLDTIGDLMYALQGVRNDRQAIQVVPRAEPAVQQGHAEAGARPRPELSGQPSTRRVGTRKPKPARPGGPAPEGTAATGAGDVRVETSGELPAESGRGGGRPGTTSEQQPAAARAGTGGKPVREPSAGPAGTEEQRVKPGWGEKNTIVTKPQYDAAKDRLAALRARLQGGKQAGSTSLFDPQDWKDLITVGMFHVEAGARAFGDWSSRMAEDLGDGIRDHLRAIWDEVGPKMASAGIRVKQVADRDELGDNIFEPYVPTAAVKGAKPHPAAIVESAPMAAVSAPRVEYELDVPQSTIDSGALSAIQLEQIIYAGAAHSHMLPEDKGVSRRRGYMIGDGCVAGNTRIYSPITGEHTPIQELAERGMAPIVLSLTKDGFIPVPAEVPFCKGKARLYAITLESGRKVSVTNNHRFLTRRGWLRLLDGLGVGDYLACSESDLSAHHVGNWRALSGSELNCQPRPQDCLAHCPPSVHSCDALSRLAGDTFQAFSPSPSDARGHSRGCRRTDGRGTSRARTHHSPGSVHLARSSSSHSENRAHALSEGQADASGVLLLPSKPLSGQQSPVSSCTRPRGSGAVTHQAEHAVRLSRCGRAVPGCVFAGTQQQCMGSRPTRPQDQRSSCQCGMRRSRPEPLIRQSNSVSFACQYDSRWDRIRAIQYAGFGEYFDMSVPGTGNYVAEGIVHHNTGVGKGREITGIILDNWGKGRKKAIWISENHKLFNDALRDWKAMGQNPKAIFDLSDGKGKVAASARIQSSEGVCYVTYGTLRSKSKDKTPKTRVQQLAEWFGSDFDGVIVFDESHNMQNATPSKGSRGMQDASERAKAGMELQKLLPNARVVYVSATAATEVSNLAYADRLGLWGPGTPFASRTQFISEIDAGGVNAMELVARDMKAMGMYLARSLSFNDGTEQGTVQQARLQHKLSPDQRTIYDKLAEAWQVVLNNIDAALHMTAADHNKKKRSEVMGQFWGSHQRFFNQVITAMQTPTVIHEIEKDMLEGRSAVIQLTNTFEAAQERALADREEGEDLEDFDITPRDMLMQFVENSFPTVQYEIYTDENNNVRSRPVLDSQGNPVENRQAVAMRDKLLDELGSIQVPHSPLDMIVEHFGVDNVSEVTGRKRRVVTDQDGKKVIQKRGASENQAETDRFMSGKKRILIFSEAGGTGASYHSDRSQENQQRRTHYLLQAGWRANKAIQGLGRTHRSNQAWAPIYRLVHTDLNGQKRFISTIARRLDQLGALTKGERKAGSTGLFTAADNLESAEAQDALRTFFINLVGGNIEGISTEDFEQQTGLRLRTEQGSVLSELPDIRQFLNRLLSLKIDMQNKVFDAFQEIHEAKIQQAIRDGTLDQGVENYRADKIAKLEEKVAYTHMTGAETKYVRLKVENKAKPITWANVQERSVEFYVRNKENGRLYAVTNMYDREDATTGRIVPQYRLIGQLESHGHAMDRTHIDYDYNQRWEKVERIDARKEWDKAVEALPEYISREEHLITGLILPVWDRLKGKARVYRVVTDDGEMLVGRVIPTRQVQQVLKNLGVKGDAPQLAPDMAVAKVLAGDVQVELVNGWRIKHALVSKEDRIEITGPDYLADEALTGFGAFKERINFKTRYFIPTGDEAADVYRAITAQWPVSDVIQMRDSAVDAAGWKPSGPDSDPTVDRPSAQGGFVGGRPGAARASVSAIVTEDMHTGSDGADDFLRRTRGYGWTAGMHPLRKVAQGLWQFGRAFHFLVELPKTAAFAQVREAFRHIMEVPKLAQATAVERMKWALQPVEGTSVEARRRLEAVRLKLIADDMAEDMENGVDLPPGLEREDVIAMKKRSDALYQKYPSVRRAYDRIRFVTREITDMLVEEGWLSEERAKEMYFPHKVIKYLRQNDAFFGIGRKPRQPYRGYLKQRKGGNDYSTDVLERLVEHWAEVHRDIETVRFLERVYRQEQTDFHEAYPDWKRGDPLPDGYKEITILPGRFYYRAGGVSEDLAMALMAGNLDMIEGILAAKDARGVAPVRQLLALGRKRVFIVREPVAKQTMDMPTAPVSDHPLYKAVASFNTFTKRQVLFNPLYAIPFHVTNFVGDAHKVAVAAPGAMASGGMVSYWTSVRDAHRGTKPALFAEAQHFGVVGSGWVGVDVKKLEALIPELERAEISGGFKVFENKAKRLFNTVRLMGQSREDWLRYATFEYLVRLQESGRNIIRFAVKDVAVVRGLSGHVQAAKIARDILGDYSAIGKSGVFVSETLAPFYRWMHLNLPWWPRMVKEYAKRGEVGRLTAALVAAAAPYLMAMLWNYSDPDRRQVEEKLPPWKRWNFHVIIAGKVYSMPMPLDDVANFLGVPDSLADYRAYSKGIIDFRQLVGRIAVNMATSPGKAVVNSVGGTLGVVRDLFGIKTFPDIADYRIMEWDKRAMNAAKTVFGAPAQLAEAYVTSQGDKARDLLWRSVLPLRPWTLTAEPIDALAGVTYEKDQRERPLDPLSWRAHTGRETDSDQLKAQIADMTSEELKAAQQRRAQRKSEGRSERASDRVSKATTQELRQMLTQNVYRKSQTARHSSGGYVMHVAGAPLPGRSELVKEIQQELKKRASQTK